jgi:Tfp pilus assembly protein PilO
MLTNIYLRTVTIFVLSLLTLGFAYLSYSSAGPQYQKLLQEERSLNKKKEENENRLKTLEELGRLLKEKSESLALISVALPKDNPGLPELFVELDNIAAYSGVIQEMQESITGNQVALRKKTNNNEGGEATLTYGAVPVSFKIKGSIPQIETFIEELYKNLRLIRVKSISIHKENEASGQSDNVYTASLQIEAAYFLSEEALNKNQSTDSSYGSK